MHIHNSQLFCMFAIHLDVGESQGQSWTRLESLEKLWGAPGAFLGLGHHNPLQQFPVILHFYN